MKYAKLLDPREALEIALSRIKPVGVEKVPIEEALGRVIAEDLVAIIDHPPFDRSTVDGYAVVAQDVYGAMEDRPIRLRYAFEVPVGTRPDKALGRGEAAYVATGAPIPANANAVIPIEFAYREGENVVVLRGAYPGMNVQPAASDIAKGEVLIRKGTRLDRIRVSLLASQGFDEVLVYKKPRALVLGIGNELVEPGERLERGKLYESNSFAVSSYLKSLGLETKRRRLGDDEEEIREALSEPGYDLYVTIGGTSKGVGDLTYKVVSELGEIIFHGLKVKPGKPTFFALIDDKPLVGLPGFPGSCTFMTMFLLDPVARKLSGERVSLERFSEIELSREVSNDTGRYLRVPIRMYKNRGVPIPRGSGDITLLAMADGVALVEPRGVKVRKAKARIRKRSKRFADVVTSHDPAFISALLDALVIPAGSIKALEAVKMDESDFGGIHILTDRGYNIGLGVKVVRGYDREIGFVVQKGNPKGFSSREDLRRVRFVNRNKGSGTRILIDKMIREHGISPEEIEGYRVEVKSHNAVAAAVASGKADVGVAIRWVAEAYGLDFIPIGREEYDFAVNGEAGYKKLLRYEDQIKYEVSRRIGYRIPKDFMEVKDEGGRDPAGESSRGDPPSSSPPLYGPLL